MVDLTKKKRKYNLNTLRPHKHSQLEFFIADEFDISTFRDELASMEHPFFALKGGDIKIREYRNRNITVTAKPTADGLATVFDKDIWIYVISKLERISLRLQIDNLKNCALISSDKTRGNLF